MLSKGTNVEDIGTVDFETEILEGIEQATKLPVNWAYALGLNYTIVDIAKASLNLLDVIERPNYIPWWQHLVGGRGCTPLSGRRSGNAIETARSELYADSDDDTSAAGSSASNSSAKRPRLDPVVTRHNLSVRSCSVQQPEPASWLLGMFGPKAQTTRGHRLRQGTWHRG